MFHAGDSIRSSFPSTASHHDQLKKQSHTWSLPHALRAHTPTHPLRTLAATPMRINRGILVFWCLASNNIFGFRSSEPLQRTHAEPPLLPPRSPHPWLSSPHLLCPSVSLLSPPTSSIPTISHHPLTANPPPPPPTPPQDCHGFVFLRFRPASPSSAESSSNDRFDCVRVFFTANPSLGFSLHPVSPTELQLAVVHPRFVQLYALELPGLFPDPALVTNGLGWSEGAALQQASALEYQAYARMVQEQRKQKMKAQEQDEQQVQQQVCRAIDMVIQMCFLGGTENGMRGAEVEVLRGCLLVLFALDLALIFPLLACFSAVFVLSLLVVCVCISSFDPLIHIFSFRSASVLRYSAYLPLIRQLLLPRLPLLSPRTVVLLHSLSFNYLSLTCLPGFAPANTPPSHLQHLLPDAFVSATVCCR